MENEAVQKAAKACLVVRKALVSLGNGLGQLSTKDQFVLFFQDLVGGDEVMQEKLEIVTLLVREQFRLQFGNSRHDVTCDEQVLLQDWAEPSEVECKLVLQLVVQVFLLESGSHARKTHGV
jgi:hypothetical protein